MSTLKLKVQSFSLYVAIFVLIPARWDVFRVLSGPENFSVFSRTVVTCGWDFRNFLAFRNFIILRVFFGNFRRTMFPIMSWGIREIFFFVNLEMIEVRWWVIDLECFRDLVFFMVDVGGLGIKGFLGCFVLLLFMDYNAAQIFKVDYA